MKKIETVEEIIEYHHLTPDCSNEKAIKAAYELGVEKSKEALRYAAIYFQECDEDDLSAKQTLEMIYEALGVKEVIAGSI